MRRPSEVFYLQVLRKWDNFKLHGTRIKSKTLKDLLTQVTNYILNNLSFRRHFGIGQFAEAVMTEMSVECTHVKQYCSSLMYHVIHNDYTDT